MKGVKGSQHYSFIVIFPSFPVIFKTWEPSSVWVMSMPSHGQAAHLKHLPPSLENSNISSQRNDTAGEKLHNCSQAGETHIQKCHFTLFMHSFVQHLSCSSVYLIVLRHDCMVYGHCSLWQWFAILNSSNTTNSPRHTAARNSRATVCNIMIVAGLKRHNIFVLYARLNVRPLSSCTKSRLQQPKTHQPCINSRGTTYNIM